MAAQWQIICGIGVLIILSLALAVFARRSRIIWITECILLFLCAVVGSFAWKQYSTWMVTGAKEVVVLENENYLTLTYAMMQKGSYTSAQEFLSGYLSDEGYDNDYLLAKARLCALTGSYREADALYEQVLQDPKSLKSEDLVRDEQEEVKELLEDAGSKTKNLENAVQDGIKQEEISANAATAAEIYADVEELVAEARESGSVSDARARKLAERYTELEEDAPELMKLSTLQVSRIQALVMAEDYESIAISTGRFDDTTTLLMFGELYRQGKISNSDLKKNTYLTERSSLAEVCLSWIEEEQDKGDFSKSDKELLKAAIEELKEATNNSKSAYRLWVKEQLLEAATDPMEPESAKAYLLLSRLAYEDEGDLQAENYLQKALANAGSSSDSAFVGPVQQLNQIVENKDDTEKLKNIDYYASLLVEHMMVEELQGIIPGENDLSKGKATLSGESYLSDGKTDLKESDLSTAGEIFAVSNGASTDAEFAEQVAGEVSGDEAYKQYVSDQVSQKTSSMNIVSIDTSSFATVSAVIALDERLADSEDKFRENVRIIDTGVEISSYQVEKLPTKEVNIVLCCDKSGSMEGSKIEDLRNALVTFVGNLDADVNVAIVPFSGYVESGAELGASKAVLKSVIDGLHAGGGTNIYDAVAASIGSIPSARADVLNMVIVMSDGQDAMPNAKQLEDLKASCDEKGTMLYTMGLGADVDSAVLSSYSDACGGQYSFVSSSKSIDEFYQYIYQLSKNRFKITYTAMDTITIERNLRVEYIPDRGYNDQMGYSLMDVYEDDLGDKYDVALEDVTIGGIYERLVAHSMNEQTLHLIGTGLTKDHEIEVSLHAGVEYKLTAVYESDEKWKLTLPAGAAVNVYDVYVTVDGRRAVFDDGFVIFDGTLTTVKFGGYVFTASSVSKLEQATILTGYVQMNGWLNFAGGVTLTGDVDKDSEITMACSKGFVYYDITNPELNFVAKQFAQRGYAMELPPFDSIVLYRDNSVAPDSDEYMVKEVPTTDEFLIKDLIKVWNPGLKLYPSKAEIVFGAFAPSLPFQKTILRKTGLEDKLIGTLDYKESLVYSNKRLDLTMDVSVGQNKKNKTYFPVNFGNTPIYVKGGNINFKLNTEKGEASLKLLTDVAFVGDDTGFEIALKEWKLDKVMLYCDTEKDIYIGNIPATISKFSLGFSDISKVKSLTINELLNMKLKGGFEISFVKISSFMPGLEKYVKDKWIKDAAVLTLENVNIEFRLKELYFSVQADAKILEMVKVGHAQLEMGSGIKYTNALLNMNEESINGIHAQVTIGIMFDGSLCDVDAKGTGDLALSDKVIGLTLKGNMEAEFQWWLWVKRFNAGEASFFIGFYQQHNGDTVFAVKVRTPTKDQLVNLMWGVNGAL